jgi:hypothetical protein
MGGGDQHTTSNSGPPKWALGYYENSLDRARQVANQPYQNYNQSRVADFTAPQQMGFDATMNRALRGNPLNRQAQNQLSQTMGASSGAVAAGFNPYAGSNPYMQGMIDKSQQDITRGFNNATQNTDAQFARAGAFGGSAWQQQQENNSRMLAEALANNSNSMRFQDYGLQSQLGENAANRNMQAQQFNVGTRGQDLSRNLSAIGMAPGLAQSDYFDINQLSGVGDRMHQQNQGLLTDAYGRFTDARDWNTRGQNVMNSALGTVQGGTSSQTSGGGADSFSQALGAALTLYALSGSDRRLKTDIKKIGKTDDGLNVYTYKYIWGGPTQMGVMYDEVKKVKPNAAKMHPSGFGVVNYGEL